MKAAVVTAAIFAVVAPVFATSAPGPSPKPQWAVPDTPRAVSQRGGAERLYLPDRTTDASRAVESKDWCAQVLGGPRGTRDFRVDLSAAHATTRAFGIDSVYGVSDAALARALDVEGALDAEDVRGVLERYAGELGDVCAVSASTRQPGPAQVHKVGTLALVVPGTGEVQLPAGTEGVMIDLRDLPAVEGLDEILARAVAPAIQTWVDRPARWFRGHDGAVDEVFSPDNVYSNFVTYQLQSPLVAEGSRDLPLLLLTGERMPAAAAELAGTLRLARRAWIVGADVSAEAAESQWRGVDQYGVAVRAAFFDRLVPLAPPRQVDFVATQDVPEDPSSTTYRRDVFVPEGARLLDVAAHGPIASDADLDIYLLYDADGDGDFRFPEELVAYSSGLTSDERVRLLGTSIPSGRYQVWAHGWHVPGRAAPFGLTIDVALEEFWPDRIPADARPQGGSPASLADQARRLFASQPGPVAGQVLRSFPEAVRPFGALQPVVTGRPETRAALLVAHGAVRLFFPYFDVVGDNIDERLVETLHSVDVWDGVDRRGAASLLRRFGEALHDGHQFLFDRGLRFAGYLPVFLEEVDGRPVVRRSTTPEIHSGDTIVSIDGRAIEDVYAELYRITSAATPGYLFDKASRDISILQGPATLELLDPDGAARQVTIAPQSFDAYFAAVGPVVSGRRSGPLGDLGAPTLYYINMNAEASPSPADVRGAIQDATARGATGLVLDMRGYPGGNHYEVAARLIRRRFASPQFWIPQRWGPGTDAAYAPTVYSLFPIAPGWNGPIVLLTGPHAVSAAENFMQMLVGAGRLTAVIGEQPSAGTNGNITGVQLPGGFGFTYTGMRVLNPDGSRHHGVGIVPTIDTAVSAADLRDGVDRDLLAAIEVLGAPRAPISLPWQGRAETSWRPSLPAPPPRFPSD